ncbi:hypothetical protein MCOR25_002633 [Pyricularia grisea]|nr:hypothetical protein MCOR25_002633 [Pyricularia grisea]
MASITTRQAAEAPGAKAKEKTYPLMSRREIEGLIADGRTIFILDGFVLKADAWKQYHPGGDKAMLHMIGRDATDEVTVLHSAEARQMMNRYRIGRIEGHWKNFVPPIQGGHFRPLASPESPPDSPLLESTTDISSDSDSRPPSPVFDSAGLKYRSQNSAPSVTSVSSVDEPEDLPDGIAFLDSLTKKEIHLDKATYPSLDEVTQRDIVQKYRDLNARIKAEGLYDCNYGAYFYEVRRYCVLFGLMALTLHWGWYITSAVFMGMFWHQLLFTAHDAGHVGITHNFHVDTVIGIFIGDFLGGLSLGWWKHMHNVHHIVTNSPEHDPDIEHLPFMAISHRLFGSLRSTYYERILEYDAVAKILVPIQHYSFYILLMFGRFNLYRLSLEFILLRKGPRKGPAWWHPYLELSGLAFFWYWYAYRVVYCSIPDNLNRLAFVLISHMVTMPLHAQLTLSHFAMSTANLGPTESFAQKMLRTTMDVDCPEWLDFFHGGLQFQAIHHMYPRIPRHNLRRTQVLVREFCAEVGIPYALLGFVDGNKVVVGKLAEVARQATFLAKCEQHTIENGGLHGH